MPSDRRFLRESPRYSQNAEYAAVPIDKLSIAVSVVFSYVVFGEKLSAKAFFGLLIFILGTMLMLL